MTTLSRAAGFAPFPVRATAFIRTPVHRGFLRPYAAPGGTCDHLVLPLRLVRHHLDYRPAHPLAGRALAHRPLRSGFFADPFLVRSGVVRL